MIQEPIDLRFRGEVREQWQCSHCKAHLEHPNYQILSLSFDDESAVCDLVLCRECCDKVGEAIIEKMKEFGATVY